MRVGGLIALSLLSSCAPERHAKELLGNTSQPLVWTTVASMTTPRRGHTATLLPSGKVLVTGGSNNIPTVISTAEIYDPIANTWTASGSMTRARQAHTATLLTNGKVLIVGGNATGSDHSPLVDLYDPATGLFTAAAPMPVGHSSHAAMRLNDGNVLVAGGYITDRAELYDPATNTWAALPVMPSGTRVSPVLGLLPSGKVLAMSGRIEVDVFDPATGSWTATASLSAGHVSVGVAFVQDGKTYAVGGWASNVVEAFDPATSTWTKTGTVGRTNIGVGAKLADGRWLLPGGYLGDASVEIHDPKTGTSTSISRMGVGRTDHSVTVLNDGRVLIAGGTTGSANVSTAEIFAIQKNGEPCAVARSAECASKICVDGVCCDAACTAACSACDVSGNVGTCSVVPSGAPHGARSCDPFGTCSAGACATGCSADSECTSTSWCGSGVCKKKKPNGDACAEDRECSSAHCTDGVCCNAGCGGQCEACDVPTEKGNCIPIPANERPHGARAACTGEGIGTTCGIRCDGVERTKCTYPTPLAVCGVDSCLAGVETHVSVCDGSGKCNDTPRSCGAYQCAGATCLTSCTKNEDCIALHQCIEGKCVPKTARCAEDGRSSIGADEAVTPCFPYTCREARCVTTCGSSAECAPGYACDPSTRACTPPTPPAEESGGCSSGRSSHAGGVWMFALALLVVAHRTRERAAPRSASGRSGCPPRGSRRARILRGAQR